MTEYRYMNGTSEADLYEAVNNAKNDGWTNPQFGVYVFLVSDPTGGFMEKTTWYAFMEREVE